MATVRVESADLDDGTPMMFRDVGTCVRMAYDPSQMDEETALALLCTRVPHLVGDLEVQRG